MKNEMGAFSGREDVFAQVDAVDLFPDIQGDLPGLLLRQARKLMEKGGGVLKRGVPQGEEALQEPLPDVSLLGVYIEGKIKVVRDKHRFRAFPPFASLQHIQPL